MTGPASKALTLDEFNARCIWLEHIRLRQYLSEHEADKHFRKTLHAVRRGSKGRPTEWDVMVAGWYRQYLIDATMIPEEDWNQVSSGYDAAEAGS